MSNKTQFDSSRARRLAALLTIVLAAFASAARADNTVRTFVLESSNPATTYGPFELRQGVPVDIAEGILILSCPTSTTIEFVEVESGRSFGPFDFIEGRVVLIGDAVYTLTGFGQKTVRAPVLPVEPSGRNPNVIGMSPSPEPVPQPIPEKPIAPASVVGTMSHVLPSDKRDTSRTTSRAQEGRQQSSRLDWLGPLRVGVGIGLLDSEEYDVSLSGESETHETSIDRTALSLTAGGDAIALSVGFVYDAEVDGSISDSAGSVLNGGASDGTGWWIGLRGDWDVWESGRWRIDAGGSASYRTEDYSLSYDSYTSTDVSIVVTNATPDVPLPEGGSEVTETVTLWQYARVGDDMTLTESAIYGNVRAVYESPNHLRTYVGLRLLAYSKTEIDGTLSGYQGDFDLDFERTGGVSATFGVSRKLGGMRWYADAIAGTDTRLTIGLTREF